MESINLDSNLFLVIPKTDSKVLKIHLQRSDMDQMRTNIDSTMKMFDFSCSFFENLFPKTLA